MPIPILSDIIDGIKWIIDFFVSHTPKSVKFIIFLLLILLFGSTINLFVQLSGIHCNEVKEPVKVTALNFLTNIDIIRTSNALISGQIVEFSEVHPDKREESCFIHAYEDIDGKYTLCIEGNESIDCKYYYQNTINQFNCFTKTIHVNDVFEFFGLLSPEVCIDDAYENPDYEISSGDSLLMIECNIPNGYFWSVVDGYYYCYDNSTCGNSTIGTTMLKEKLDDAGAEPLYKTKNEDDIENLIQISCNTEYKPKITFLKIDIFNYKIWVLLMVISVLVVLLFKLKGSSNNV